MTARLSRRVRQHVRINDVVRITQMRLRLLGRKIDAEADTVKDRWPDIEERSSGCRRICDLVALVEQILSGRENLEVARQVSTDLQVHDIKVAQWKQVLVIIELIADEAPLNAEYEMGRIPITGFPREGVPGHLSHVFS